MLIGGTLVAVHGNALVDHAALAIQPLAQRLHHQLLQIAAEHLQAIAIGEHHHVALALAFTSHVPGGGHQGSWIVTQLGAAGGGIHHRGTAQEGIGINACQHSGQQPHGAGDGGAAPHPIEHVETIEPSLCRGLLIKLAVLHGHGHSVLSPAAAETLQTITGLHHADVGLRGAA